MTDAKQHFELQFTGAHAFDPAGKRQVFRSDDMLGEGGRLLLTLSTGGKVIEVPYGNLSRSSLQDLYVEGEPVVRVCRKLDGTIVGEWLTGGAARTAGSPPVAAPHRATENQATTMDGTEDPIAGALRLAGSLFGRSASEGLRSLGSLLSNVSQEIGGVTQQTPPPHPATSAAFSNQSPTTERLPPAAGAPTLAATQSGAGPATPRMHPSAAPVAQPAPIPSIRSCEQCQSFRPYVRIWERLAEELGPSAAEAEVSQALDQLRSMEEKGKGEEARHLAALYRRGADRWAAHPSYFSYCGAHERDPAEPTFFIAQIRNVDQRCRPVRKINGQRWNDAPTDFAPRDARPHSCKTCAHRVKAPGPGEDAAELREIVAAGIQADLMGAAYGKSGGSSVVSSYADGKRKNAAAARAREAIQAFVSRGMDSHAPVEPRYLDRCGVKSDPSNGRYRICAVENANDRCADWEPI